MKGTSKLRSPHLSADRPFQRLRGCFLGDNAAVPPAYRVKVQKCAILDVCKFTTFCDRKGYTLRLVCYVLSTCVVRFCAFTINSKSVYWSQKDTIFQCFKVPAKTNVKVFQVSAQKLAHSHWVPSLSLPLPSLFPGPPYVRLAVVQDWGC